MCDQHCGSCKKRATCEKRARRVAEAMKSKKKDKKSKK